MFFKENFIQLIKFSLVGASSAAVSFGVYSALVYLGAHYIVANFFAFVISVLNSFLWNSLFVFKKSEGETRSKRLTLAKTFVAYGVTGLLLASALLFLFISVCGLSKYISQALCILINIPLNFALNKFWAYKTSKADGGAA